MTISTTASRISYNGNGATVAFSFPYRFLANRDIVVVLRSSTGSESILLLGTHYTLSGAGGDAGGTVTMAVAPAIGERLVIYRSVAITQETDYISGDPFPAETHEQALDRLTMIDQQQQDSLDRTLRFPVSDTVSPELPTQAVRANKLLAFDALGNPTTAVPMTDSSTDVRLDLAEPGGASLVGFIQPGAGTTGRTLQDKVRESVSVKDFGAVGDGVVDDTLAMNTAAVAAGVLKVALRVPAGVYKMTATWSIPIKVHVIGESLSVQDAYDPGAAWAYGSIIYKAHNGNAVEKIGLSAYDEGAPIENITVSSHRTTYPAGNGFVLDKCSNVHLIRCNAFGIGGDCYQLGVTAGDVTGNNYVYNCYSNNPAGKHYNIRQKWGRYRDILTDGGTWGAYLTDAPESDMTGFHFEGFTVGAIKLAGVNTSSRFGGKGFIGNTAGALIGIEVNDVAGNQSLRFDGIKLNGSGVPGSKAIYLPSAAVDCSVTLCELNQWTTAIDNNASFSDTQTTVKDNEFSGNGLCIRSNSQHTQYAGNSFIGTTGSYDIDHVSGSIGLWSGNTFSKGINPGVTGVAGNFSGIRVKDNAGYVTRMRGVTGLIAAYANIAHGLAGVPHECIAVSCLSSGVTSYPQIALRDSANFQLYWTGTANVQWAWEASLPCDY